ncbi:MAG TPA: hypothetical protein VN723_13680 [Rhizomicrobium sp.]|nr:hypothetical protein [Rhizomicrobium sp.]
MIEAGDYMRWQAIVLIGLVLLGSGATYFVLRPESSSIVITHQGAAALIQAIWSVLAVVLALIIPGWQDAVTAQNDYKRRKRLLQELVKTAAEMFREQALDLAPPAVLVKTLRDALAAFPVSDLQTAEEARDLMDVRNFVTLAYDFVVRANGQIGWDNARAAIIDDRATAAAAINRLLAHP